MTETISRPRSGARKALSLAVMAGVSGAMILGSATGAHAARGDFTGDPAFTGPTTNPVTDSQGGAENATMYGAYIPSGGVLEGKRVYCADGGLDWPAANAFEKGSDTRVNAPKLAYVFNKYEGKDQGSKAKNMARDMAVSSFVKHSKEIRHRHIVGVHSPSEITGGIGWDMNSSNVKDIGASTFQKDVLPEAQRLFDQMLKETENLKAQPKKLGIDLDVEAGKATVTLTDGKGEAVSGYDAKVTLTGATFADGKTSTTVETGDEAVEIPVSIDEPGKITANVEVKDIPPTDVIRWTPKGYTDKKADSADPDLNPNMGSRDGYNRYSVQEVYEGTKPTSLSASTEAINKSRPSVVTTISDPDLRAGDQVYDNFDVSGLGESETVDVHHELWYSPVKPEQTTTEPQDGHVLIEEITSEGVGNGSHRTDETAELVTLPDDVAGGYLYWRESIEGTETTEGWEAEYGIPDETGFIPYKPVGQTNISETETASLPIEIHDDGRITGGMPGQVLTVSLEAFQDADCVIEQSAEIPEDATSLGVTTIEVTLDENGEGTYSTDKLELAEGLVEAGQCGAVTIVETIAGTDYNEPEVSDYGIPEESIVIDIPAPEEPEPNPEEPQPKSQPDKPNPVVKTGGEQKSGFWSSLAALLR